MKNIICLALTAAVLTTSALGQGTLRFANDATSLIRLIPDWTNDPVPLNSGYAQLLWAPVGTTFRPLESFQRQSEFISGNPGWLMYPPPALIGPQPGLFDGGFLTFDAVSPGANVDLVVAGVLFPDLESALIGVEEYRIDDSPRFTIQTGTSAADAPSIVGLGLFGGITLGTAVVPEPSTFSLFAFAAAALGLKRWRKYVPTGTPSS